MVILTLVYETNINNFIETNIFVIIDTPSFIFEKLHPWRLEVNFLLSISGIFFE